MTKKIELDVKKLKQLYNSGINIISYLKESFGKDFNKLDFIELSYDLQSGSYIKQITEEPSYINSYTKEISRIISQLSFDSILEGGIGDGTTIGNLLGKLNNNPIFYGFDISFSRLLHARKYLQQKGFPPVENLFLGDLFNIPLKDNSIDLVFTSHSIEPNGGREIEALKELYRITKKYLILLEPCYEFASEEAKTRMREHGYITNLFESAKKLGFKILEYKLFDITSNSLNPTGIMIIEKKPEDFSFQNLEYYCPISNYPLKKMENVFYSEEGGWMYPIIRNIPCLLKKNGILSTQLNII